MKGQALLLASTNKGKLAEIRHALAPLGWSVVDPTDHPIPEVEEDGTTFAANALKKARSAAAATGLPALADDSGLMVDALNGAPGVVSARFAALEGAGEGDASNNALLLRKLEGLPPEERTARFVCALALVWPDGGTLEAQGVVEGRILTAPRGENGFGYDPLFFVPELGCTTAELSKEEKNRISHRGRAIRDLVARLEGL